MKLLLPRRTVTTTPEAGMEPSKLLEASAMLPIHHHTDRELAVSS